MIPKHYIQDLVAKTDIVDVVSSYIPLKQAGIRFKACCPFHSEKSPSFTVNQAEQFYHCFGCGAHGNVVTFVMEHRGLAFPDAIQEIADKTGLGPVPNDNGRTPSETCSVSEQMRAVAIAAKAYQNNPMPASVWRYLTFARGLTEETIREFGIGYAPGAQKFLAGVFPDYETNTTIEGAGLVYKNDFGVKKDRFYNRIMFPIHDSRGRPIAFGARAVGDFKPKYINSTSTEIFNKSVDLYGIHSAQKSIKETRSVIVVEGYIDVIMLYQNGIRNTVAAMGTSFTEDHGRRLLKVADKITFCFDGDFAGQEAAMRTMEIMLPVVKDGQEVSFAFIPDGADPDDYIKKHGINEFRTVLQKSKLLSNFLIDKLKSDLNLEHAEGAASFRKRVKERLGRMVQAPILSSLIAQNVDRITGIVTAPTQPTISRPSDISLRGRSAVPALSLERHMSKMLFLRPSLAMQADIRFPDGYLSSSGEFLCEIIDHIKNNTEITSDALVECFRGTRFEASAQEASLYGVMTDTPDLDAIFKSAANRYSQASRMKMATALLATETPQTLSEDIQTGLREIMSKPQRCAR